MEGATNPTADAAVRELLTGAGWQETGGDDWTLLWSAAAPRAGAFRRLGSLERGFINHIWGVDALTQKYRLRDAAAAGRARLAGIRHTPIAGFLPDTYLMPEEAAALRTAAAYAPRDRWMRRSKAVRSASGPAFVASIDEAAADARALVQREVADPHLLDGFNTPCASWSRSLRSTRCASIDSSTATSRSPPSRTAPGTMTARVT